jgi:hypothetical protein
MFPVKRTVFIEFKFFLGVPAVFACGIIFPLAYTALKGNEFYYLFFACHISSIIHV